MTVIKTTPLAERLLSRTAVLAGAAVALPLAANAGIISGPVNVTQSTSGSDVSYGLDVNGDMVSDFTFVASFNSDQVTVTPLGGNGYVGILAAGPFPNKATALSAGSAVNGMSNFLMATGVLQKSKFNGMNLVQKGPWPTDGVTSAYLGIELALNGGGFDYGLVQIVATTPTTSGMMLTSINATDFNAASFTILSVNGTAVPEPSSLALFAAGAAGIAALRLRRKRQA